MCDYCKQTLQYGRIASLVGNKIIGRSKTAGYICQKCYESRPEREFDWLDARTQRLYDQHVDDKMGVMLRAAHGKQTREERRELIDWMKDAIRSMASLPYDKRRRNAA